MPITSASKLLLGELKAANWEVVHAKADAVLPNQLVERYDSLPADYVSFLLSIDRCVHPAADVWFLGLEDFSVPSAYSWDEFEQQSLAAAEGDESWQQEIRSYWDNVVPVALSVRTGYSYLGLRLEGHGSGIVVLGREPEFEESLVISPTFQQLCEAMIDHLRGHKNPKFLDFL
jgi:hypothetical protein